MGKLKKIPAKTSSVKVPIVLKSAPKFKPNLKGIHRLAKDIPTEKTTGVNEFADFSIKKSSSEQVIKSKNKNIIRSGKGKVKRLTKKERQQLRKEQILERIQATQKAFIEDKAREKREKTEIIKDVKPLLDALPSLGDLFQFKNYKLKTGVPAYDKPKGKSLEKQERREQKTKEFQEKLTLHKNLVQNFLPVEKRREAIREAIRRRREAQMNNGLDAEMKE